MKIKKLLNVMLVTGLVVSGIPNEGNVKTYAVDTNQGSLNLETDFCNSEGKIYKQYISALDEFDRNKDGKLSKSEQLKVDKLILEDGSKIEDLPHVYDFVNIKEMSLANVCMDIDFSVFKNLETVRIKSSMCSNMNFSGCKNLDYVYVDGSSNLENISLNGCKKITGFDLLGPTKINSLDFSDTSKLIHMNAKNNDSLKSIYVHKSWNKKNLIQIAYDVKEGNRPKYELVGFYYDFPCTVYFGNPGEEKTCKKYTGNIATEKGTIFRKDPGPNSYVYYKIIGKNKVAAVQGESFKGYLKIADVVKYEGHKYKVTELRSRKKDWAFCDIDQQIVLGKYVERIDANVFANCRYLRKITFGKNFKYIEKGAFKWCEDLSKVVFKGKAIKRIGKDAFYGTAKNLKVKAPKKARKKYMRLLKKAGANQVKFK